MATKTASNKSNTKTVKKTNTPPTSQSSAVKSTKTKHNTTALGVFLAIIVFFFFLYAFKGLFVAASVNGEPISRFAVIKAVEKQDGKQTLDSMITKALIVQEAKKRNVTVSQSDIDGQIDKISKSLKAQGSSLDQAMAAQGMTKSQLNDEIRLQLYLQKMVGSNFSTSEKEITDFIAQNKSQFPDGTTDAQMRTQAITQIKQQKAQLATQTFLKNLQTNSKTIYFVRY